MDDPGAVGLGLLFGKLVFDCAFAVAGAMSLPQGWSATRVVKLMICFRGLLQRAP